MIVGAIWLALGAFDVWFGKEPDSELFGMLLIVGGYLAIKLAYIAEKVGRK